MRAFTFPAEYDHEVRVVVRDGQPWWVAADVCEALAIANSRDAIRRLNEDEKNTVGLTDGTPGNPNKTLINEPGLYRLIFTSRKPEAERFKRWVFHEVLPAIRRTGGYQAAPASDEGRVEKLEAAVRRLEETQRGILQRVAPSRRLPAPPQPIREPIRDWREDHFRRLVEAWLTSGLPPWHATATQLLHLARQYSLFPEVTRRDDFTERGRLMSFARRVLEPRRWAYLHAPKIMRIPSSHRRGYRIVTPAPLTDPAPGQYPNANPTRRRSDVPGQAAPDEAVSTHLMVCEPLTGGEPYLLLPECPGEQIALHDPRLTAEQIREATRRLTG